MEFVFGSWSPHNSNIDCRAVLDAMSEFFQRQSVAFAHFKRDPNFAAGVASFSNDPARLQKCFLETQDVIAVGDVQLYGTTSSEKCGLARLTSLAGDEQGLAALNGEFAAAILDKQRQSLTLVRDHCGLAPLHYSFRGDACAFSSLVRPLLAVPWGSEEIDEIALASFLVIMAAGRERTFYRCAKTVLPASRVTIDAKGSLRSGKFWHPIAKAGLKFATPGDAYEAVRGELVRAVTARAHGAGQIGVKLSGGLDSSTIAGILSARFPDQTVTAVSSALPLGQASPISDEREYIEEMGQRYANLQITYETATQADPLEGAEHWATWVGSPVADSYYFLERRLAQSAANQGVKVLLSGDGGDHCVSSRATAYLAECVVRARPKSFVREFRRTQVEENLDAMRVIRHRLVPHLIPAPLMMALRRRRRGPWESEYAIASHVARNAEVEHHLRECGFAELTNTFALRIHDEEVMNLTALDSYPPSVERIAFAPFGVNLLCPLFDRELLEMCMAVPSEYKVGSKLDRMLIREAARPFLPVKIAERFKKGWFCPDFQQRIGSCSAQIRQVLSSTCENDILKRIIDYDKVHDALPLLEQPISRNFDLRMISQVLFPYRAREFVQASLKG